MLNLSDCPGIPWWETWINACIHHYLSCRELWFSRECCSHIWTEGCRIHQSHSRTIENKGYVKKHLVYLKSNLNDGIATYEEIQSKLFALRTPIYGRNSDFHRLRIIRKIISGWNEQNDGDESDVQFVIQFIVQICTIVIHCFGADYLHLQDHSNNTSTLLFFRLFSKIRCDMLQCSELTINILEMNIS